MHAARSGKVPPGPVISALTVKMIDGVLNLFDSEGRRLDHVTAIALTQSVESYSTVTVTLMVDVEREAS